MKDHMKNRKTLLIYGICVLMVSCGAVIKGSGNKKLHARPKVVLGEKFSGKAPRSLLVPPSSKTSEDIIQDFLKKHPRDIQKGSSEYAQINEFYSRGLAQLGISLCPSDPTKGANMAQSALKFIGQYNLNAKSALQCDITAMAMDR